MMTDSSITPDFDLPKVTGELIEHDYSNISPEDAFRLFDELNKALWENDVQWERRTPVNKRFIMD